MRNYKSRLENMTPVQIGLAYGLVVLLLAGYHFFLYSPKKADLTRLEARASSIDRELLRKQLEDETLARLSSRLANAEETIRRFETSLGMQRNKDTIVQTIGELASSTGVYVSSLAFSPVAPLFDEAEVSLLGVYGERLLGLPVEITVEGSWIDLHRFVHGVDENLPYSWFRSITVTQERGREVMKLVFWLIHLDRGGV